MKAPDIMPLKTATNTKITDSAVAAELDEAINHLPIKVLQFGEGNFLRAFIDWMIQGMNDQGLFNGRVSVVQPIDHGMVEVLNDQNGLYTLLLRGIQDGQVVVEKSVIQSIARGINPYTHFDAYLKEAENPQLRIIVSNTTEAGIEFRRDDPSTAEPPLSFPGKLLRFMKHRFDYFKGDPAKGFLLFPCELIDRNGDTLKDVLTRLAETWYPEDTVFKSWLLDANVYFNTLVDRIVSGYPKEEAEALADDLGYTDALIDTGEIFHFLVIEGPRKYEVEFPLITGGFNVTWCDDMTPYRTRKVRILNGAHTMTVLAAHLYGLETVKDCMDDPVFSEYIRKGIFEEIIPTLTPLGEHESERDSTNRSGRATSNGLRSTEHRNDSGRMAAWRPVVSTGQEQKAARTSSKQPDFQVCNNPTIQPSNHPVPDELEQYGAAVLERFANPYIRHLLLSISLNSVSKFKTRVLLSLLEYQKRQGTLPEVLTFSLAALILFYRGMERRETSIIARRPLDGKRYDINDSPDILDEFLALWTNESDLDALVRAVLGKEDYWDMDLNTVPELTAAVSGYLQRMIRDGVPAVVKQVAG